MTSDKILTEESFPFQLAHEHKYSMPILLATGCFDVIHRGHVEMLQQARACFLGHTFWVGLNSDRSVRELKGNSRPVHDYQSRAIVVAGLECVDQVFEVDDVRVAGTIRLIRPHVWVKGSDYTLETLDQGERKAAEDVGAIIHFLPLLQGYSTSSILRKAGLA